MEGEDKLACFNEISHIILDSGGKVTISRIGKSWNLNSTDSSKVLEEWKKKCKSSGLKNNYLVKGIDNAGVPRMTVISEDKLDTFRKNYKQLHEILYSIELAAQCNSLDAQELYDDEHIQLKLEHVERKVEGVFQSVSPINAKPPVKEIKKEVIAKKSPIQINSKQNGSSSNEDSKKTVLSMFATTKPKSLEDKDKLLTPKKEQASPQKPLKTTPKSPNKDKGKSSKVVKKNSIASFFGTKPTQRSIVHKSEEIVPEDIVMIEDKPKEEDLEKIVDNETKLPIKRPAESTESENDAKAENNENLNPRKKIKQVAKVKKTRAKGSRIIQNSDSSDEDEANTVNATEETPDHASTPPQTKTPDAAIKKRVKATKTVSKTYEDENGYLCTVKEIEEYSASENEKSPVKVTPTKKKAATPQKKTAKKQKECKKQGSITSFFTKK